MRVLITGATGFIGGAILQRFNDMGIDAVGICSSENTLENIERVDMANLSELCFFMEKCRPSLIFHCAGAANVSASFENTTNDFEKNVVITNNLMQAISKIGMKDVRIVYLSSAAVYGNPISLPVTENTRLNPISPYALHKVLGEEICRFYYENYHMDIRIARIFSAYGPGLKKQIFWDMYNKLSQNGCLQMFGNGDESRDYIYIDDLVNALLLIGEQGKSNGFDDGIYNVANGQEISIREIAEKFAECSDADADVVKFSGARRVGDPVNWRADITKLTGLGYHQKTDIYEGIRRYIKWREQYPEY